MKDAMQTDDAGKTDDDGRKKRRLEIGTRVREARQKLKGNSSDAAVMARALHISESQLSRYETGAQSLPTELLYDAAKHLGVHPLSLLPDVGHLGAGGGSRHPFYQATEFLQNCMDLGAEYVLPNREAALAKLAEPLRRLYQGKVQITGSSFKGLLQNPRDEFVKALIECSTDVNRKNQVQAIMTHPLYGFTREGLENRLRGAIVAEIFQGIRWLLQTVGLHKSNIKLMRAAPSSFTIFMEDDVGGTCLVNPYPMMQQAYNCFAMVAARPLSVGSGLQSRSIFVSFQNANFSEPWGDSKVTADLDKALEECRNAPDYLDAEQKDILMKQRDFFMKDCKELIDPATAAEGPKKMG